MTLKTNFAVKPALTGELVRLRPVEATDAAGMLAVDPETKRLTGSHSGDFFTIESLEKVVCDRLDLSIIEQASGKWAGEVVLNELDVPNESCGFRIVLQGPRFYGRGLGSEVIIDYGFSVVGVHRIELEVFDFNPRARHVYENFGFVHEGTKRVALQWDGEWIDCHWRASLALLEDDWCPRPGSRQETGGVSRRLGPVRAGRVSAAARRRGGDQHDPQRFAHAWPGRPACGDTSRLPGWCPAGSVLYKRLC